MAWASGTSVSVASVRNAVPATEYLQQIGLTYLMIPVIAMGLAYAHAVRHALQWDALVPDTRIESTVSHGAVTIAGEVDFAAQREDAEQAIRNLTGVRQLVNKIRVEPVDLASAEYVKKAIEDALTRRLARELSHINVEVREGCVILSGAVPSWAERRAAIGAATSAPGVHSVQDQLRIEP